MQVRHYVNVLNYLGVCDLKTHGSFGIRCGSSLRSSPGRSVIECLKQDAMIRHFWSQARKEDLEVDREFFSWCLRQTLSFVCFVSFASWIWNLSSLRCLYRETPCCSFSFFFQILSHTDTPRSFRKIVFFVSQIIIRMLQVADHDEEDSIDRVIRTWPGPQKYLPHGLAPVEQWKKAPGLLQRKAYESTSV